jgi:hypothetical protein
MRCGAEDDEEGFYMGDVIDFEGGPSEEAAREKAREKGFDAKASILSQLELLRKLCEGQSITITVDGRILTVPYKLWITDLEKRLLAGGTALSFDDDPESGTRTAKIITLESRPKPKKKRPRRTLDMDIAERGIPSDDDYLKSLRLEQEEAALSIKRDYIEKHFGKDQAEVFALLVGWR